MNLTMDFTAESIRYFNVALVCWAVISLVSCRTSAEVSNTVASAENEAVQANGVRTAPKVGFGMHAQPKAVIYQTNGDYRDNVVVTLNASRDGLLSYPAPTDVTANSAPLAMDGGWWLDRRGGISANSAFLQYTYEQYRKLSEVSPAMLMESILPDARVTMVRVLPVTASQAISNPTIVNQYIRDLK